MGKDQESSVSYSTAKAEFSAVVRKATQEHSPVVLERQRGAREGVVVVDRDDLARALADHRFETQAFFENGRWAIALEDFGLHGAGSSFEEALANLLDALRAYADDYFGQLEFYRHTPNRAHHYLPLLRFRATPLEQQLALLLETDAREAALAL